jgi:arylesterase / paraoxonase
MNQNVTRRLIILATVVVGVMAVAARTYYFAGEFTDVTSHYDGFCVGVNGIAGAEDATVDQRTGIAFISSYDRRRYRAGIETQGAIFAIDVHSKNIRPRKLTDSFNKEFHPHGISLYIDADGKTSLFVINHTREGSDVEIFNYSDGVLTHRESINNALMWRPNDIQAVGPRSFYVSNDHGSRSSLGRLFEDFIPLKNSYLLYFDGETMSYAATDIGQANGINISADGKKLYAAATTEKSILVFTRNTLSGALTPELKIPLPGFPDNIERDTFGRLYVAVMPKALTYMAHSNDGNKPAPTQVFRITPRGPDTYQIEEHFVDDGRIINAATVAAPFDGGMLLGPSKDNRNRVLLCRDQSSAMTRS